MAPEIFPENNSEVENNSPKTVLIGETEYPAWAIDEAKKVMEKFGGNLESTVQAVLRLDDAKKRATHIDPNAPGRGYSHHIGGHVVPKLSDKKDKK